MMYLLTPEEHAQIVDALWVVVEHNRLHHGESSNTVVQCTSSLAMLKAMKPVEPTFYMNKHQIKPRFYREGETLPTNVVSLYAKEKQWPITKN